MIDHLQTLGEAQRERRPNDKGRSRLQERIERDKVEDVDERAFKNVVWRRDGGTCRKCYRRCARTLARVENRGEVHHLHGRIKALRWFPRTALLLCAVCHEQVTGKVAEKWVVKATKFITIAGRRYTDASWAVRFERIV